MTNPFEQPQTEEEPEAEDGEGVLDVTDLDYTDEKQIAEVDNQRFVVTGDPDSDFDPEKAKDFTPEEADSLPGIEAIGFDAKDGEFTGFDTDATFAFKLFLETNTGSTVVDHESDDVTDAFEHLVREYVSLSDAGFGTEEVLKLLINESDLPVRVTGNTDE